MARNALVLGGGGALGIAWEIGVLSGLLEEGIDTTAAQLIVGTSAGSRRRDADRPRRNAGGAAGEQVGAGRRRDQHA